MDVDITLTSLVDDAQAEFCYGATIPYAVKLVVERQAVALGSNECERFLEILPKGMNRPTDLWFVPDPTPYMVHILLPEIEKRLLRRKRVQRELKDRVHRIPRRGLHKAPIS